MILYSVPCNALFQHFLNGWCGHEREEEGGAGRSRSNSSSVYVLSYSVSVTVVLVAQSCPTLCNPMACGLPGFSVHDILQVRILEWVAMPASRGSS